MTPTAIEVVCRAVIRRGSRILLVRVRGEDWWFLPGGHVEPGEPSGQALARELREELGAEVTVTGDPVALFEHFYDDQHGSHHEFNVVFFVDDRGGSLTSQEPHLQTAWIERGDVSGVEIRPEALRELLPSLLE